MVKITICDDNKTFTKAMRKKIRAILDSNGIAAEIHIFNCAKQLPEALIASCDVFFLDIDFDKKPYNGIDIAKSIRRVRQDSVIVFVTNFIEYAPEGYEVQAFRYLLKKDIRTKLELCLLDAIGKMQTEQASLAINISGKICRLPLYDILYIEAQSHAAVIYAKGKDRESIKSYKFYASLSNLEEQLASQGFLRIQKSYLVNMNHLEKLQCNQAVLDDGKVLPVSEKNYAERKQAYLRWKGLK